MAISKAIRERVWNKYGCKCAYCGNNIEYKKMQIDHIEPAYHNWDERTFAACPNVVKGSDDEGNLNPSCARCNKWKGTWSIEDFRREIQAQIERLNKYSSNYRMAKDYGLLSENNIEVKFDFETLQK